MHVGMAVVAFCCTLLGVAPGLLYNILPHTVHFAPYTVPHLVETTQILVFTFIGFWVLRVKLAGEAKITLDTDWFYRRPAKLARLAFVTSVDTFFDKIEALAFSIANKLIIFGKNPYLLFKRTKDKPYTPDRYRPAAQLLVFSILGLFILLTLAGILFKQL
jgi:multicomponent Na+:H+ antiporter subunit D